MQPKINVLFKEFAIVQQVMPKIIFKTFNVGKAYILLQVLKKKILSVKLVFISKDSKSYYCNGNCNFKRIIKA